MPEDQFFADLEELNPLDGGWAFHIQRHHDHSLNGRTPNFYLHALQ